MIVVSTRGETIPTMRGNCCSSCDIDQTPCITNPRLEKPASFLFSHTNFDGTEALFLITRHHCRVAILRSRRAKEVQFNLLRLDSKDCTKLLRNLRLAYLSLYSWNVHGEFLWHCNLSCPITSRSYIKCG